MKYTKNVDTNEEEGDEEEDDMSSSGNRVLGNRVLLPKSTSASALSDGRTILPLAASSAATADHSKQLLHISNEQSLLLPKKGLGGKILTHYMASSDDDDDDQLQQQYDLVKQQLLARSEQFTLPYDVDRGYRATELKFLSMERPFMRAFHASWICFFVNYFVQFCQAPLLPEMKVSLHLTKADIWWTNLWMMVGGIPTRFLLGPLCDKYGARSVLCAVLAAGAIPCAATGWLATDVNTLTILRFALGAMDAFVPSQYWITCHFVREVGGTAMAITGGLGASGAGVTQLVTGSAVYSLLYHTVWHGDADAAWRWTLLMPAILALGVAWYFYYYSDDCPLGNFDDVKKAGLMMERSAVESFRAGVYNLNSWILCAQFAGSCGVDFTMCNGAALYYNFCFGQTVAASGAMAFLYGIGALYARGLGGWLSDAVDAKYSLKGRLWAHMICMLIQGIINIWFARTANLLHSLMILVLWSILIQMSMGTTYGIVPYIDSPNTGSIAGIVGAGGNAGAAVLALLFMHVKYSVAMECMGWFTIALSLLSPLIVIRGYHGICFDGGTEDASARVQHSPLMVPGKLHRSPHLVSMRLRRKR